MRSLTRKAAVFCLALAASAAGALAQTNMTPVPEGQTGGDAPAADGVPIVDIAALMTPGPLPEKTLGDPKAPVTLIEYASLTCSHCGNFYRTVFGDLKSKYIDTGKVYFVLREFPLDQLALAAAMTARCGEEADYFTIIDKMFADQDKWAYVKQPGVALLELVKPFGFTSDKFEACVNDQTLYEGVVWVAKRASETFGVNRTPTFFFNGAKYSGELTGADLDATLAPLLAAKP